MPKYLEPTLIFGALGAALTVLNVKTTVGGLIPFVLGFMCFAAATIFLIMTVIAALAKNRKLSGWKLFAIGDIVLILFSAVIGAYDLITAKDSPALGPGLLGGILFYYGIPALAAVLVIEYFVWRTVRMMNENAEPEQHTHDENCTCEECIHGGEEEQ
jgi:fructose-specific phosphotransferase system IIC component